MGDTRTEAQTDEVFFHCVNLPTARYPAKTGAQRDAKYQADAAGDREPRPKPKLSVCTEDEALNQPRNDPDLQNDGIKGFKGGQAKFSAQVGSAILEVFHGSIINWAKPTSARGGKEADFHVVTVHFRHNSACSHAAP